MEKWLIRCQTSGDSPAHWCAWTRPGCRPESRCRCTVTAGRSECSRSGCSGRRCRPRRPAGRAGGATRRWLSPRPSAPCTAAPGGRSSGSTQVTRDGRLRRKEQDSVLLLKEKKAVLTLTPGSETGETLRPRTLLSFPPEASSWWSVLHLSPQTSCLCPWRRRSDWRGGALMSRWRITRSRLPDDSWSAFHANAPGRQEWNRGEDGPPTVNERCC